MAQTNERRLTPQLVQAWIAHVFSPLIRGLDSQASLLEQGGISGRFHSQTLEYLAPVRERMLADERPLLEQLLRYFVDLLPLVEAVDRGIDGLRQAASRAQGRLDDDDQFQAAVLAAHESFVGASPEGQQRDPDWQGAFPADKRAALAAQNVINNLATDGNRFGYCDREFWAEQGPSLLDYRSGEVFDHLDRASRDLVTAVRTLIGRLIELRDELADRHGLPAVSVA